MGRRARQGTGDRTSPRGGRQEGYGWSRWLDRRTREAVARAAGIGRASCFHFSVDRQAHHEGSGKARSVCLTQRRLLQLPTQELAHIAFRERVAELHLPRAFVA